MNQEAADWISEYSKEAYLAFAKIDSLQERFRNLVPLYVALGTGYYFMGVKFPHFYSDGHLAFFYLPYSLGLFALLVSISLMLYTMFWMVGIEILGDPAKFYETCDSIDGEHEEGKIKEHLDILTAKERCMLTSRNRSRYEDRSRFLNRGARIGVVSFVLLVISAPRFIATAWYEASVKRTTIINATP